MEPKLQKTAKKKVEKKRQALDFSKKMLYTAVFIFFFAPTWAEDEAALQNYFERLVEHSIWVGGCTAVFKKLCHENGFEEMVHSGWRGPFTRTTKLGGTNEAVSKAHCPIAGSYDLHMVHNRGSRAEYYIGRGKRIFH